MWDAIRRRHRVRSHEPIHGRRQESLFVRSHVICSFTPPSPRARKGRKHMCRHQGASRPTTADVKLGPPLARFASGRTFARAGAQTRARLSSGGGGGGDRVRPLGPSRPAWGWGGVGWGQYGQEQLAHDSGWGGVRALSSRRWRSLQPEPPSLALVHMQTVTGRPPPRAVSLCFRRVAERLSLL